MIEARVDGRNKSIGESLNYSGKDIENVGLTSFSRGYKRFDLIRFNAFFKKNFPPVYIVFVQFKKDEKFVFSFPSDEKVFHQHRTFLSSVFYMSVIRERREREWKISARNKRGSLGDVTCKKIKTLTETVEGSLLRVAC